MDEVTACHYFFIEIVVVIGFLNLESVSYYDQIKNSLSVAS